MGGGKNYRNAAAQSNINQINEKDRERTTRRNSEVAESKSIEHKHQGLKRDAIKPRKRCLFRLISLLNTSFLQSFAYFKRNQIHSDPTKSDPSHIR